MNIWGLTSPSQVKAQAKYDKEHTTRISLKLNLRTDRDILQWLQKQTSMQGAIKRLVREEIARTGAGREAAGHQDAAGTHPHTDNPANA